MFVFFFKLKASPHGSEEKRKHKHRGFGEQRPGCTLECPAEERAHAAARPHAQAAPLDTAWRKQEETREKAPEGRSRVPSPFPEGGSCPASGGTAATAPQLMASNTCMV